jgi:hypothetical protein
MSTVYVDNAVDRDLFAENKTLLNGAGFTAEG